jgi:hypothetical protein
MEKTKDGEVDFYYAALEGGELVMEPHCACGNFLEEEYFCEQCKRQCVCKEIRCKNDATLEYVKGFLESNEKFKNFTVVLDEGTGERNE